MRQTPVLLLVAMLLITGCSSKRRINTSGNDTTPKEEVSAPTATEPPTTLPATSPTPDTTTTGNSTPATTNATSTTVKSTPTTTSTDPQQTAEAFIVAAFTLNETALRALSTPAYADQAVNLWITPTDDFGAPPTNSPATTTPEPAPRILATKVLVNAAGQARVAVFVDAEDLAVAALPYTVDLIENNGVWLVLDAGLPTT
jgi:hypothetical protein